MNKLLMITVIILLGFLIILVCNKSYFLMYNRSETVLVSPPEKELLLWKRAAESKDPYSMYIYGLELLRRNPRNLEGEEWIDKAANLNQKDAVIWMVLHKGK